MRRICLLLLAILSLGVFSSCAVKKSVQKGIAVTDALGNVAHLSPDSRVVSCYGSFADGWLLSGGRLSGVTEDAVEQGIVSQGEIPVIGSVKQINLELLVSLNPDYVILSADLTAHLNLHQALSSAGIAHGYFRVDTFEDYKELMGQFCAVSGRDDLYQAHVLEPEARIRDILDRIPSQTGEHETVLLMRVYSTGMKAKRDDNLAGQILKEFGLVNLADQYPSLLEDLSVEQVVLSDPSYIFSLSMGNEEAAKEYLRQNVENNKAWQGLCAVQEGRYHLLPKELFHYKPNEQWDESYEYLAKIIWPEIFG